MNQLLIDKTFDNFEDFAAATQAWDVDFLQIDKGRFEASLVQFMAMDLQFARACFNRRLDQRGTPPQGVWTFAITASPDIFVVFKNREVTANCLMVYPPGSEICAISKSRFDILTFSAPELFLEMLAENNKLPGFRKHCKDIDVFLCDKGDIETLRCLLMLLFSDLKNNGVHPAKCKRTPDLISTIPKVVLSAVYRHEKPLHIPAPTRLRDGAFNQAMACIKSFAKENLTVKGLVRQTGVSERTLEYVFQERLGLSPKQYIRTYRLNHARRALIQSTHPVNKISDIANTWGFWHMGQFAGDYKALFGELPSETLGAETLTQK